MESFSLLHLAWQLVDGALTAANTTLAVADWNLVGTGIFGYMALEIVLLFRKEK